MEITSPLGIRQVHSCCTVANNLHQMHAMECVVNCVQGEWTSESDGYFQADHHPCSYTDIAVWYVRQIYSETVSKKNVKNLKGMQYSKKNVCVEYREEGSDGQISYYKEKLNTLQRDNRRDSLRIVSIEEKDNKRDRLQELIRLYPLQTQGCKSFNIFYETHQGRQFQSSLLAQGLREMHLPSCPALQILKGD